MNEKSKKLRHQWLRDSREVLDLPHVRADVGLFSENAGDIFRYNVGLGMIAWREGGNPTPFFNQAIDDISMCRDDLISRGMPVSKLPVVTATIIASLIDRQSQFSLSPCELDFAGDLFLDCCLAKRLQDNPPDTEVQQGLDRLGKLKRQALAGRTYKTYFELLDMEASSSDLASAIAEAEANYSARRKDAFYSGGWDIEGGGQYNDIAIDYRLSAIAKFRGFPVASVHGWRW